MENNNKTQITKYLADNIAYYRKKMSLTQLELATKLSYSDKSISKWERGDGVPDIFVLKDLSLFFGVTVDQLTSKRSSRFSLFKYRYILAYFYASIVWLIAGTSFGILSLINSEYPAWHILIYAIPFMSLILLIFFIVWRRIGYIILYFTIFIWTIALSITISIDDLDNIWVYIAILPVYLFILFMFYIIYKRKR